MEGLNEHKDGFDKAWQDAFADAEIKPPEAAWVRLDAHLAQQAANKSRKALIWYRWVAAAAVVLLLALGSYVFLLPAAQPQQLAEQEGTEQPEAKQPALALEQYGLAAEGATGDSAAQPGPLTSGATPQADALASGTAEQADALINSQPNQELKEDGQTAGLTTGAAFAERRNKEQSPAQESEVPTHYEGKTALAQDAPPQQTAPGSLADARAVTGSEGLAQASTGTALRPTPGDIAELTGGTASELRDQEELSDVAFAERQRQANQAGAAGSRLEAELAEEAGTHGEESVLPGSYPGAALLTDTDRVALRRKEVHFDYPERPAEHYILPTWEPYQEAVSDPTLWAGLSLGGGGYAHNYSTGSSNADDALAFDSPELGFSDNTGEFRGAFEDYLNLDEGVTALNTNSSRSDSQLSGTSFSLGADAGWALSKRWSLIGGLYYAQNSIDEYTNAYRENSDNTRTPIINENQATELEPSSIIVVGEQRIPIQNRYAILGIPLQANFLLVNRKFNLALQAGAVTNVFLQSRISSSEPGFNSSIVRPGEEGAPYNRFSWQATMGLSLGYQLTKQYSLQLSPAYRFALSPLTDTGGRLESRPRQLSISLGLRYQLN